MDDVLDELDEESYPPYMVEGSGCFGSVSWGLRRENYNLLARDHRNHLLDIVGERIVTPYFVGLTERLLRQTGCHAPMEGLDGSWCMEETMEIACRHCKVVWQVGQGLWDSLPEDQRRDLLAYTKEVVHEFFEHRVVAPLVIDGMNNLRG